MTIQTIGQAGGGLESVGRAGVPDPLRQETCSCHTQFPGETHKNNYPTYYQTVVASPQWLAWGKVAHQHGFDWDESVEIGVLSPKHFQAFLAWIISEAYKKGFIDGGLSK